MPSPAKSRRKVVWKDQLPYERSLYNWVVCLKILVREQLFNGEKDNWDQITPSNSPRAHWHHKKIGERKGPSRGVIQKPCASWAQSVCSRILGQDTRRNLATRKMRPQSSIGLGEKCLSAQKYGQSYVFTLRLKPGQWWRPLQKLQRNDNSWLTPEHPCTCWAKTDLSSDEMETLWSSRNPTTVVTANGEVRTNEEAQVYVHDPGLFVTVQILDGTLAVLSLWNTLRRTRIYLWVGQRSKTTVGRTREEHFMPNGKLRTSCCP